MHNINEHSSCDNDFLSFFPIQFFSMLEQKHHCCSIYCHCWYLYEFVQSKRQYPTHIKKNGKTRRIVSLCFVYSTCIWLFSFPQYAWNRISSSSFNIFNIILICLSFDGVLSPSLPGELIQFTCFLSPLSSIYLLSWECECRFHRLRVRSRWENGRPNGREGKNV